MAYQSNSATGVVDLLDELRLFLTSNGFVVNVNTAEGNGWRLTVNKNGRYFNFRALVNESAAPSFGTQSAALYMNASTGFNGANAWYDQPNAMTYNDSGTKYFVAGMSNLSTIVTYHFHYYGNSDYDFCAVVLESPAGTYQRLLFGKLSTAKYGNSWTGTQGMWFNGSNGGHYGGYSLAINFFGEPLSGLWTGFHPYGAVYDGSLWMTGNHEKQPMLSPSRPVVIDGITKKSTIWANTPNSFNGLPVFLPVDVYMAAISGVQSSAEMPLIPIGEIPNLYWTNIKNLVSGSTLTFGSDTYVIYPFCKKSDTWDNTNANNGTYYLGMAIKNS